MLKRSFNIGLLITLFIIIPKGTLSRLMGYLARIPFPKSLMNLIIQIFCNKYAINKHEILYPDKGFRTFDHFFTRRVKDGIHSINSTHNSIISPTDSVISQFGSINKTSIIQAKGVEYSLDKLIPSEKYKEFIDGTFITLYLSPSDYHRIHSPVNGKITGYFHIPGKLYSVQEFMVNGFKGLFSKNERIISYILTEKGMSAICMIGAMNVGRITLNFSNIITNKTLRKKREIFFSTDMQPMIKKGDELGKFHIGSTIILLFNKDAINFSETLKIGDKVRVGDAIAFFN